MNKAKFLAAMTAVLLAAVLLLSGCSGSAQNLDERDRCRKVACAAYDPCPRNFRRR